MTDIIVTTLVDESATFDPVDQLLLTGDLDSETLDGDGLSLREAIQVAQDGDRILFADDLSGVIRVDDAFSSMALHKIYGSNGAWHKVSFCTEPEQTPVIQLKKWSWLECG